MSEDGSPKLWLTRKDLEAELVRELRQKGACLDLLNITVYDLGMGEWTVGHIRLGRTKNVSIKANGAVERRLAKEIAAAWI